VRGTGIVGWFGTTSGTGYGGGFIGKGTGDVGNSELVAYLGAESATAAGVGLVYSGLIFDESVSDFALFVVNNFDTYDSEANTSETALFREWDNSFTGARSTNGAIDGNFGIVGGTVDYSSADDTSSNTNTARLYEYNPGGERIAAFAFVNNDGNAPSHVVASGLTRTGELSGNYTWSGIAAWSNWSGNSGEEEISIPTDANQGSAFELVARFGGVGTGPLQANQFRITTTDATKAKGDISGTGTVDATQGTFTSTSLSFTPAGQALQSGVRLDGRVVGEFAGAAVGVITTGGKGATDYVGGFVAGTDIVASIDTTDGRPSLAGRAGFISSEIGFDGLSKSDDFLILAGDAKTIINEANSAGELVRQRAVLNNLASALPASPAPTAVTGGAGVLQGEGSYTPQGGTSVNFRQYQDRSDIARLRVVDGAGQRGLIVAGGTPFNPVDLTVIGPPNRFGVSPAGYIGSNFKGAVRYAGVYFESALGTLGSLMTNNVGSFTLDLDFYDRSFTITSRLPSSSSSRLTLTTGTMDSVNLVDGTFQAGSDVQFQPDGGVASKAAYIRGQLLGDYGVGVVGIFSTTGTAGVDQEFGGGFVGSRRQYALAVEGDALDWTEYGNAFGSNCGGSCRVMPPAGTTEELLGWGVAFGTVTSPAGVESRIGLYSQQIASTVTRANRGYLALVDDVLNLDESAFSAAAGSQAGREVGEIDFVQGGKTVSGRESSVHRWVGETGDVTLYHVDYSEEVVDAGQDSTEDFDIGFVTGTPISGTLAGRYEYQGLFNIGGAPADLADSKSNHGGHGQQLVDNKPVREGSFTLTLDMSNASTGLSFLGSITGTDLGVTYDVGRLAGSGPVPSSDGKFHVQNMDYTYQQVEPFDPRFNRPAHIGDGGEELDTGQLFGQLFGANSDAVAGFWTATDEQLIANRLHRVNPRTSRPWCPIPQRGPALAPRRRALADPRYRDSSSPPMTIGSSDRQCPVRL